MRHGKGDAKPAKNARSTSDLASALEPDNHIGLPLIAYGQTEYYF